MLKPMWMTLAWRKPAGDEAVPLAFGDRGAVEAEVVDEAAAAVR